MLMPMPMLLLLLLLFTVVVLTPLRRRRVNNYVHRTLATEITPNQSPPLVYSFFVACCNGVDCLLKHCEVFLPLCCCSPSPSPRTDYERRLFIPGADRLEGRRTATMSECRQEKMSCFLAPLFVRGIVCVCVYRKIASSSD